MHKEKLHQELNFLVFFGKFDAHTIKRMPIYWRKKHVQWTIDNLNMIYGNDKSSGRESREMTEEDAKQMKKKRKEG